MNESCACFSDRREGTWRNNNHWRSPARRTWLWRPGWCCCTPRKPCWRRCCAAGPPSSKAAPWPPPRSTTDKRFLHCSLGLRGQQRRILGQIGQQAKQRSKQVRLRRRPSRPRRAELRGSPVHRTRSTGGGRHPGPQAAASMAPSTSLTDTGRALSRASRSARAAP